MTLFQNSVLRNYLQNQVAALALQVKLIQNEVAVVEGK